MTVTYGYKLFRQRKDGTLGPLFINARRRVPVGQWLEAECIPTKGFAVREGWHATLEPIAPHLKDGEGSGRVWCAVALQGAIEYARPESQGGTWLLADKLKVLHIVEVVE